LYHKQTKKHHDFDVCSVDNFRGAGKARAPEVAL